MQDTIKKVKKDPSIDPPSQAALRKLQKITTKKIFEYNTMKNISQAAGNFTQWILKLE